MERFCAGDQRAFDVLFARYHAPLLAFLTRWVGTKAVAEELVQTTFLSFVRARGRFDRGASVRPWLYAIASNVAKDHLRRRRVDELTTDGELPLNAASAEEPARDAGLARRVQDAVDKLPESLRGPVVLHRFHELPFSEIALILGISETAAKVRAHRGYAKLRELLSAVEVQG